MVPEPQQVEALPLPHHECFQLKSEALNSTRCLSNQLIPSGPEMTLKNNTPILHLPQEASYSWTTSFLRMLQNRKDKPHTFVLLTSVREMIHTPHLCGWQLRGLRSCSKQPPNLACLGPEHQGGGGHLAAWSMTKDHDGSSFQCLKEQTGGCRCRRDSWWGRGEKGGCQRQSVQKAPGRQRLSFNRLLGTLAS